MLGRISRQKAGFGEMKRTGVLCGLRGVGALFLGGVLCTSAGGAGPGGGASTQPTTQPLLEIGRLDHGPLGESSGLAASQQHAGVFWTHNDGGNPPLLYAVQRSGELAAEVPLAIRNIDWEDIALADGNLYLADIGNNTRRRDQVQVYQFSEPDPGDADPAPVRPRHTWSLRYPGAAFDSEALFVMDGRGYLISKQRNLAPAVLYRFALDPERPRQTLERVMTLPIRVPVTAADLSPDGRWLAVMTVAGPRVFEINGDLDRLGTAPPLSATFLHPTMEAACFVEEGVLATTERRQVILFTWTHLHSSAVLVAPGDERSDRPAVP